MSPSGNDGSSIAFAASSVIFKCVRIFIRSYNAVFSVLRKRDVRNIPRHLLHDLSFTTRQAKSRNIFEVRPFVGDEIQILRVLIEGLRGSFSASPSCASDILHFLCLGAVEINVGVRRRVPAFVKCDEALVIRDRAEIETGIVLVKQRRFQVRDWHDKDVEELWITRVGRKKRTTVDRNSSRENSL